MSNWNLPTLFQLERRYPWSSITFDCWPRWSYTWQPPLGSMMYTRMSEVRPQKQHTGGFWVMTQDLESQTGGPVCRITTLTCLCGPWHRSPGGRPLQKRIPGRRIWTHFWRSWVHSRSLMYCPILLGFNLLSPTTLSVIRVPLYFWSIFTVMSFLPWVFTQTGSY